MSYVDELTARGEAARGQVKTGPLNALRSVLLEMPVRAGKLGKAPTEKVAKREFEQLLKQAQDAAAHAVLSVVCGIETAKIAPTIKDLDDVERDTLMKFVYRGFQARTPRDGKQMCTYDCQVLLKVHEEICKSSGTGPVIRTIHTRLEV